MRQGAGADNSATGLCDSLYNVDVLATSRSPPGCILMQYTVLFLSPYILAEDCTTLRHRARCNVAYGHVRLLISWKCNTDILIATQSNIIFVIVTGKCFSCFVCWHAVKYLSVVLEQHLNSKLYIKQWPIYFLSALL